MALESAGILLYRRTISAPQPHSSLTNQSEEWGLEVFLAHPGGPFWADKDAGAWTIPKGVVEDGEKLLEAAIREFQEETGNSLEGPFISLGSIKQKSGKVVHAWACEGDAGPEIRSNYVSMQWAGKRIQVPEIDRCEWFPVEVAIEKINPAQAELIIRLVQKIASDD